MYSLWPGERGKNRVNGQFGVKLISGEDGILGEWWVRLGNELKVKGNGKARIG